MNKKIAFTKRTETLVDYVTDSSELTKAYGSITDSTRSNLSREFDKDSEYFAKKSSLKSYFVNRDLDKESEKNISSCKRPCATDFCDCQFLKLDTTQSELRENLCVHRAHNFLEVWDVNSETMRRGKDVCQTFGQAVFATEYAEKQEFGDIFLQNSLLDQSFFQDAAARPSLLPCMTDLLHAVKCTCSGGMVDKDCKRHTTVTASSHGETIVNSELLQKIVYTESDDFARKLIENAAGTVDPDDDPKLLMYYTPDEVVVHSTPDDIWVSYYGMVYDLTPLVEKHKDTREIKPVLAFAGKDISDWFDPNGELRHHIHPITGVRVLYLPHGSIPDIRPHVPTSAWRPMCACEVGDENELFVPWWRDRQYLIGRLTKCARPIRIINMLTQDECTLTVCCEDTLNRILERLLLFNKHATSYTFKYDTRVLDMNKTLDENCIFDQRDDYLKHYLPDDIYIPAICLYFNDDLQWDLDSD